SMPAGLPRLFAVASAAAATAAAAANTNSASSTEESHSFSNGDFFPSRYAELPRARLLPGKSSSQPAGLSLASVSVLMRHGARTPLHKVPGYLGDQFRWPTDVAYQLAEMDGVQMQLYDPLHPGSQPSLMRPHRQYLLGGAQPGSLTRLGQADMIRLGQRLRRDYRQLVNDNLRKHKEDYGGWLYCRSTSILRCVQSLQCVLAGLLLDAQPGESLEASAAPATVRVAIRSLIDEDLFPNFRTVPELQNLNLANASALLSRLDGYLATRQQLANAFGIPSYGGRASPMPSWNETQKPRENFVPLYFARDDLSARLAHGSTLPGPVAKLCPTLDRLCALELLTEEMGPCEIWEEALPYCIGTWVHTLASNVDRLASGRGDHHRFELYSSHDSMLLPVLLALGFDPRSDISWPPFGSAIVFEFYTNDNGSSAGATASQERIWCRVLYQDRAVQLPGCQSEFAPLSVLSDRFFRLARPREGFVEASQAAGRELNSWYREHGLAHLEPWPYDADSTGADGERDAKRA
ncbi:hypothetical protein BOX15_Mlig002255g1, partial [Macrostomum lignano]